MSADLKRKAGELPSSDSKKPKVNSSITSFFGAPKSTSSKPLDTSPLPSLKFDKSKWAASLTPDQRDLLSLEIDTLDPTWLAHLKEEILSREFLDLKRFLKQERAGGKTVLPPPEDMYSWSVFRSTPPH
jgi:uracil-DNA glycosylase